MAKQVTLKAVLFDFDGTLVDLPTDYEAMREELTLAFRVHGVQSSFRPLLESLVSAEQTLRLLGYSEDETVRVLHLADEIVTRYELEAASNSQSRPGAERVLAAIKSKGLRTAIVTNNSRIAVNRAIDCVHLPRPDVIVARGDAQGFKPLPAPLILALERLGVTYLDAIFVGDSEGDYAVGRAIGIRTILVGSNHLGKETVASLDDITNLLRLVP
jgi:phosphoglycolate phosphatase